MKLAGSLLLAVLFVVPSLAQGPPRRVPYSSRCGSEVQWRVDLDAALREAKKLRRPVLWFVPTAHRTPMDRKQELYWYMMGGAFQDPWFVALVNASFVPLKLGLAGVVRGFEDVALVPRKERAAVAKRFKLGRFEFIEPGFLILGANGKVLHAMDRLHVYNRAWLTGVLARVAKDKRFDLVLPSSEEDGPGMTALRAGRPEEAAAHFDARRARSARAAYFAGVCRHLTRRTAEGDAIWRALAEAKPDDRWAWKAKLELDRWGPFMGGFERYRNLPAETLAASDLETSRASAEAAPRGEVLADAVSVLLRLQRDHGGWDDSRYDFGGLDSVPNVHVAVSALVALSLLEWRDVAPKAIDEALTLARGYLLDESRINPQDRDEIAWAHAYRLMFFSRLVELRPETTQELLPRMQAIADALMKRQRPGGSWRHEYAAPFTTATVLVALRAAADAGVKLPPRAVAAGVKILADDRRKDGTYGYSTGGRSKEAFAAGRMPLCELALLLHGASTKKKLARAVKTAFEHHELLEAVRQYDDHADSHGYGGFFFWYDLQGRADAVRRCAPSATRKKQMAELRKTVLSIREVDGGWIDSHEIGKAYGTAMALIVLKMVEQTAQ